MVVHNTSDYVLMEQLEKEFVPLFTLGNIMNCVYNVKVEAKYGPLFVFKNYRSSGENLTKLFCTLPEKKLGKYFRDKIYSKITLVDDTYILDLFPK